MVRKKLSISFLALMLILLVINLKWLCSARTVNFSHIRATKIIWNWLKIFDGIVQIWIIKKINILGKHGLPFFWPWNPTVAKFFIFLFLDFDLKFCFKLTILFLDYIICTWNFHWSELFWQFVNTHAFCNEIIYNPLRGHWRFTQNIRHIDYPPSE